MVSVLLDVIDSLWGYTSASSVWACGCSSLWLSKITADYKAREEKKEKEVEEEDQEEEEEEEEREEEEEEGEKRYTQTLNVHVCFTVPCLRLYCSQKDINGVSM